MRGGLLIAGTILTLGIIIADALLNAAEDFADDLGNAFADTGERLFWMLGSEGAGLKNQRGGGRAKPDASDTGQVVIAHSHKDAA